jgi:hypothetical protein
MVKLKASYAIRGDDVVVITVSDKKETWTETYDYQIAELMFEDMYDLPCGCTVEPDGICHHGVKSPLLILEMI